MQSRRLFSQTWTKECALACPLVAVRYMVRWRGCAAVYYGLNQASRTWHYNLVKGIKPLGFEQCEADVCVMRSVEDGAVDIACLFAC